MQCTGVQSLAAGRCVLICSMTQLSQKWVAVVSFWPISSSKVWSGQGVNDADENCGNGADTTGKGCGFTGRSFREG